MRRTGLLRVRDQSGDFFEKWVSRGKVGTGWDGGTTRSEKNRYTPQMAMRGSPYPKFPAWWGIPKPDEAVAPSRHRDWDIARKLTIEDLTPAAAKRRETRLP
eukprot:gene18483-28525_t